MTEVVETDALNTLTVETDPTIVLTETATGPQGPAGPTGATGPTGADGAAGNNTTVVHDQASASTTWTITHNQGRYPAIDIIDSAGNHVIGDIKHNSVNQAVATFDNAFAGKAIIV
tara:strand:+ start:1485 stop:1832 length:348 start_codon:yes stop_codon:yes gene_type:complete